MWNKNKALEHANDHGLGVQIRKQWHLSFYNDDKYRIDYFPKHSKYHDVAKDIRGRIDPNKIISLFPVDSPKKEKKKVNYTFDDVLDFFKKNIAGKPINIKFDKNLAVYEINDDKFSFTITTKAGRRPKQLTVPYDIESITKRCQVYLKVEDQFVSWITKDNKIVTPL